MPDSDERYKDDSIPNDEPLSDEEKADVRRPFFEAFGIEPKFAADEDAPPVDERCLAAFVRDELPREEWDEVWRQVTTHRSWFDAWRRLMRNETS
jgi:hypothetical protein